MSLQSPPIPYPEARQRDGIAENTRVCPTCGGPWSKKMALKVCRRCGQPIARNHKHRLIPAGPGLFALEHRDCHNPTGPNDAPRVPAPESAHDQQIDQADPAQAPDL